MVLDPIPQSLPVHFFGSRPQPPTSPYLYTCVERSSRHVYRDPQEKSIYVLIYDPQEMYSRSHLGWHFRMPFQSSKLKARTSLFTETWQKRCSSFELWAFENVTPSGIGCTRHVHVSHVGCVYRSQETYMSHMWDLYIGSLHILYIEDLKRYLYISWSKYLFRMRHTATCR